MEEGPQKQSGPGSLHPQVVADGVEIAAAWESLKGGMEHLCVVRQSGFGSLRQGRASDSEKGGGERENTITSGSLPVMDWHGL